MKLTVLLLTILLLGAGYCHGQKKPVKPAVKDTSDVPGMVKDQSGKVLFDPRTDSIPNMADTVSFISNADLSQFEILLRQTIANPSFAKADPITQHEMILTNCNQVFINARARWELKNKIKKAAK